MISAALNYRQKVKTSSKLWIVALIQKSVKVKNKIYNQLHHGFSFYKNNTESLINASKEEFWLKQQQKKV